MNKLKLITDEFPETEFLSADGFEDAIIGVVFDNMNGVERIAYSKTKCINILIDRDNMTYEEALEYFDFNVEGAYVGKKTPIWVEDEFLTWE